jgi:hypothetical protein
MPVDFIVGAAVGAALASTSVRQAVRKGLVYGVGGALVAYDTVTGAIRHRGQEAASTPVNGSAAAPEKDAAMAPTNQSPPPDAGVQKPPVPAPDHSGVS